MKKIYKKSFNILKNNMIFIQPFLLYLLMIMLAMPYLLNKNGMIYPKILLLISLILLTVAHTSGWLYINKAAFFDYNEQDSKEEITIKTIKNFKSYFTGVGEYFFKTLFGYIIFSIFYVVLFFLLSKLCLHFLGTSEIASKINDFKTIKTTEEFTNALLSFPRHDIIVFQLYFLIYTSFALFINFFGILYFTSIFFEKCNIMKTFVKALLFFFKNLFASIGIILTMFILYMAANMLTMSIGVNSFSFAIFIIAAALYFNYYILLVFCFYNERQKTNSNNGTEFIGEDSIIC